MGASATRRCSASTPVIRIWISAVAAMTSFKLILAWMFDEA
jgi:hypothetical protein